MIAKSLPAVWIACLALAAAARGHAGTAVPVDDPAARPGLLVQLPDHRRLNFRCSGHGSPTVLLESGFGADATAWYKVQPTLAARYRVCAYDRAGAGFSDPGPAPRDGAAIAHDLDDGLRADRIGGPFVVVGHSAGGLYMRVFADRRPKDVVGMVLVDPSVPHQDRRFAERFGPGAGSLQPLIDRAGRCLVAARAGALPSRDPALGACVPGPGASPEVDAARLKQVRSPGKWAAQISELETLWTSTSDEVESGRFSYGAMPLIVLTADGTYAANPPSVRPTVDALWSRLHQEIAARSTRGREERVSGSSHLMMLDRPDAIISAVDEVVDRTRRQPVSKLPGEKGK